MQILLKKVSETPFKMTALCVLVCFFSIPFCEGVVRDVLKSLPEKDKEEIAKFFQVLVYRGSFGYTLWGTKPMSVESWPVGFVPDYMPMGTSLSRDMEKGCFTWKQHAHLFPIKKFIFSDQHITRKDGITYHEIYLIHTPECKKIYQKYSQHFDNISSPEILLRLDCEYDFGGALPPNIHFLLGLLLGYGEHNAALFQRRADLMEKIGSLPLVPRKVANEMKQIGREGLKQLQWSASREKSEDAFDEAEVVKQYMTLDQKLVLFSLYDQNQLLSFMPLPQFMADLYSTETHELYNRYSLCRKQIRQQLNERNFLEVILEKLCEDL